MKVKRISIRGYKSFRDFEWSKFCKNESGQEEALKNFSVIFGENGAGKSAICDVLKSLSQERDFQNTSPVSAEVRVRDENNENDYKYENGRWDSRVEKNSFLFFDVGFVTENVHTHGVRSSNLQQGAHTQRAGELIIDLDKQANDFKETVNRRKGNLETFRTSRADILGKQFTDKDRDLFRLHGNDDDGTKKRKLRGAQDDLKKIEPNLKAVRKLNEKHKEIGRLSSVEEISSVDSLSSEETYTELFTLQIKEKAQGEADEDIKAHFEKHKQFIESAKDQIPPKYEDENCPLCMQPLTNAVKVIEYYRNVFDKIYETERRKFLTDIQTTTSELETIKSNLNSLPTRVAAVFDAFEKMKTEFEIPDIYKLEEKAEQSENFREVTIGEIDNLLAALESLKGIERIQIDVAATYNAISSRIGEIENLIIALNELVGTKNKSVEDFKSKYSEQNKITDEIQEIKSEQAETEELVSFLEGDKFELIKNQEEAIATKKGLSEELKDAEDDLKNYLADTIPESVIAKMMDTLEKFNLGFVLKHIKPSQNTKEYPFSFRVKDLNGNERELKDELSEGERQIISLAFFFAINENLQVKNETVLVFDDPITSLDSPNLKILAELIHEKAHEFDQVIVLTHHPLFYKYLAKCTEPSPSKYGVLKNKEAFGGSFMFFDPGFDLISKMQECGEEINQRAQSGDLKPEEITLKYGQLLRLAVEKFIKHELLMWDKESDFGKEIVANLSISRSKIQKLDDADLEVIKNIYKYCNYSNLLHADKENPSALSELSVQIDRFVKILEKART